MKKVLYLLLLCPFLSFGQANTPVITPDKDVPVIKPVPHPTTQSGIPVYTEPCPMVTGGVGYSGTRSGGFNGTYSTYSSSSNTNLTGFAWLVISEIKKAHNGKREDKPKTVRSKS